MTAVIDTLARASSGGPIVLMIAALAGVMWAAIVARTLRLARGTRAEVGDIWVEATARADGGTPSRTSAELVRLAARLAQAARHPAASLRGRLVAAHAAAAAAETRAGAALIRGMVAAAPLLGLLGTVSGMVETFGVLGGVDAWTQGSERGMARGISTALWTTELGLVVSIPGLLASYALERRAAARRREIAALVTLARGSIAGDREPEATS